MKHKVQESITSDVFSLVIDEMAIHQQIQCDGRKYHGYINMGTELDDASFPVAKKVLTYMIVSNKSVYKFPVGYYFIDGLSSSERSSLVLQILSRLHSIGENIMSLMFDGAVENISMMKNMVPAWILETENNF